MAGKKILIVEDDQSLATLISIHLSDSGYESRVAVDGVLAMTALRDFKPDLVILDMLFPAGGGAAFHRRLRQFPFTALTPILVLSAIPEAEALKMLEGDPRTQFLAKPYSRAELLTRVSQMLDSPPPPPHDTERLL